MCPQLMSGCSSRAQRAATERSMPCCRPVHCLCIPVEALWFLTAGGAIQQVQQVVADAVLAM